MIPAEILKNVRLLELRTRKTVNDVLAGEYHSAFKGRGMEFEEVREYVPGDDVRQIDWNVTARTGHPHVKSFREERELTVFLMVDISASGKFGSQNRSKQEIAAEIAALIAFSAIKNNDKVGLILFSEKVELFIPPKKGRKHVLRVIRELLYFEPQRKGTAIKEALEDFLQIQKKRCIAFLMSDFLDQGFEKAAAIAGRRHDLIAVNIHDPHERALPASGMILLQDLETGQMQTVDASNPKVREAFAARSRNHWEDLKKRCIRAGIDLVDIATDKSYTEPLQRLFHGRRI